MTIMMNFIDGGICFVGGLILLIWGIASANNAKPTFAVRIGTAGGESNVLESSDSEHIQKIVDAMNKAIVYR
ncbi:MAG: hypothetical protein A2V81_04430 [Candidatus Abawacabacteria bacterium RBG_16_42_10]|uniref:Uncharacterized protein n=1 Tax=Candidatus Abawacabacteria bacterium RBG_16_42_10 TaxID=1817814 RepID=A0A1F4XIS5_9BACT|nr:MAG: hypothetical protein A2V81_04430 [Candidatus Abawacabacteria bacterium RBG_16_42_10]